MKDSEKKLKADYLELNPVWQKEKAQKALDKAKQLEKQQQTSGKKLVKLNNKTIVLR